MAKKPTGFAGHLRIGPKAVELFPVVWPKDQAAIERKILDFFVRESQKAGAEVSNIRPGGTKDLDFRITTPGGESYLELMEAVVEPEGRPYKPGNRSFKAIEYAEIVYAGIDRKTKKYGMKHEIPIDLLIYTTHHIYNPAEAAIFALRRLLIEREHPFHYVFMLSVANEELAQLDVLFNRDHPLSAPSREELKNAMWIAFDLQTGMVKQTPAVDLSARAIRQWTYSNATRWWW